MQVAWPWDANPVCSQTFIHILILKNYKNKLNFFLNISPDIERQSTITTKYIYHDDCIHFTDPPGSNRAILGRFGASLRCFRRFAIPTSIIKVHVCRHVIHAFHFKTSTICELNSANIIPKYINPIVSSFFTVPMSLCSTVFLVSFIKVT